MEAGQIVLRGKRATSTGHPPPHVQPPSPPGTETLNVEPRHSSPSNVAIWVGCAGALMLAAGTWFASRAILQLGPSTIAALVVAVVGGGLAIAAAALIVAAPAHVDEDARRITTALEAAARGDLTRDPEVVRGASSLVVVAMAARRVVASLRAVLGPARIAAREAAQRAEELGAQCSVAHVSAQRSAELGAHVAEQASAAARASHAVHAELGELCASVSGLEEQRRLGSETWLRAAGSATTAARDLDDAARGLEDLSARFHAANAELAGLGRSVEDVREFVDLVRKMARQSKLLSLNAAMEAARAGESGSGFGVVAAEVRRLARSSSEAADRTEGLLADLLRRAGVAQESARESLALVRNTRDAVERSRSGLAALAPSGGDATVPGREASAVAPASSLLALTARLDQLAHELDGLAQAAKDSRLAGTAQVARAQDLIAAAHSLAKSAARAATGLQDFRLEATPVAPAEPEVRGDTPVPSPA